jgi:hypothetical protein
MQYWFGMSTAMPENAAVSRSAWEGLLTGARSTDREQRTGSTARMSFDNWSRRVEGDI